MRKKGIGGVRVSSILVLTLSFWGFAAISLPGGAFAEQKPIIIRYTHHVPETQPFGMEARVFAKCVQEKSKGKVLVEVYPAAQLFTMRDAFPAIRKGAVEMGIVTSGITEGVIPLMGIFEVPFLFQNWDQLKNAWYGYTGEILKQEFERSGVKLLGVGYYAFIDVNNSKREIRTPKDFKGLKLRSIGPLTSEIIKLMGGSAVVMGGDEAYLAMARKTVDGSMTGLISMVTRKIYEVTKYVSVIHLNYASSDMVVNMQFWKSLPEDVQNLCEQCAKQAEEFVFKETISQEKEAVGILKEKGMMVYTPTPPEMEEFRKVSAPIREAWIKKHGDVAEKIVKFVENLK